VVRAEEPFIADERTMLEGWLDFHRTTLIMKCAGLTGEQLAARAIPPSSLSPLGLIRHSADVERSWFRRHMNGEDVEYLYWRHDSPEAAFEDVDPSTAADDYASLMTNGSFPGRRSPAIRWTTPLSRTRQRDIPALGLRSHDRGIRPP
jgi:hypothetical protein